MVKPLFIESYQVDNDKCVWLNKYQLVNGITPVIVRMKGYFTVSYLQELVEVKEYLGNNYYKVKLE